MKLLTYIVALWFAAHVGLDVNAHRWGWAAFNAAAIFIICFHALTSAIRSQNKPNAHESQSRPTGA